MSKIKDSVTDEGKWKKMYDELEDEVRKKDEEELEDKLRKKDEELEDELRKKDEELEDKLRKKDEELEDKLRKRDAELEDKLRKKDEDWEDKLRKKDEKNEEKSNGENQKLEAKTAQLDNLTSQLEERVRCPVCLEVPTAGPIFICSAGHCICSDCYKGPNSDCPMCRTRMHRNTSLLAVTVIENIEHSCKFKGCEARMALAEVEEHTKTCSFRVVTCPAILCKSKVAYNQMMDHILNTCNHSYAKTKKECTNVVKSPVRDSYTTDTTSIGDVSSFVQTFTWDGKFFFLTQHLTNKQFKNVYMQMLGTQKECEKYTISIAMKDTYGKNSLQFSGQPCPIDMDEKEKEYAGLKMTRQDMVKFCTLEKDKPGRSSYHFNLTFEAVK